MLRRIFIMAAIPNSRGRALRADSLPLSKGGRGRHHAVGVEAKPPTGRPLTGHHSERALISGLNNLSLRDSARSSASSVMGHTNHRRPFSSRGRPVSMKSVEDVATLLREELVKNVVVVVGAGISTPSGIPDFRSPGTGLYDNLQQYSIPYAEAIFDIDYFHHNPRPFFTLAKELYPSGKYRPNYLHYFAKLLHDRGLLLRIYTQNIDGLERIAGIPTDKMVEAHGTFSTATCVTCRQKYDGEEIKEKIYEDKIPRCKRATCAGIVKPDIVFFGEELPKRFYFYLKDMLQADLVIVMGTSLEVQPFAGIIDTVRFTVPRILFNRTAVGPFHRHKRPKDFIAAGDLIEQIQQFVAMVGWSQEMENLITQREGCFKTAFPPPVPESGVGGEKKVVKGVKSDPLAAMWRQNAQFNFYSDSDSSDTDSGMTPSDTDSSSSDSEQKEGRGKRQGGGVVVGKAAGKSSSSSTVSSSSSGCVSSASTRSIGHKDLKGNKSGSVLNRSGRSGGGGDGGGGGQSGTSPSRSFSQQAVNKAELITSRKAPSPFLGTPGNGRRTAWSNKNGPKPPPVPANHRKPPLASGRGNNGVRQAGGPQRTPAPGTHALKPRANSVNKAVPEKLHTKTSENLKTLYPRVKSAHPTRLAYRHRMQPSPYDARILAVNADVSDSSSSEDCVRDEDTDDSSDDS